MYAVRSPSSARNPKLLRSLGACVWITLGLACASPSDEGTSAACDVIEAPVEDLSCGTFEDSDEGCEGSGGEAGTGGGGTGGGGTGGGCDPNEAANDAVAECVAQAVSDGVDFSFGYHYYRYGGQFNTRENYHVGADGSLWVSSSGDSDLCTFRRTAVYSPLDLSTCGSYGCIRSAANGQTLAVCVDEENCNGV